MAVVTRVLPWRRDALPAEEVAPLLAIYKRRHKGGSTALISRAYATAANAHTGQRRARRRSRKAAAFARLPQSSILHQRPERFFEWS